MMRAHSRLRFLTHRLTDKITKHMAYRRQPLKRGQLMFEAGNRFLAGDIYKRVSERTDVKMDKKAFRDMMKDFHIYLTECVLKNGFVEMPKNIGILRTCIFDGAKAGFLELSPLKVFLDREKPMDDRSSFSDIKGCKLYKEERFLKRIAEAYKNDEYVVYKRELEDEEKD